MSIHTTGCQAKAYLSPLEKLLVARQRWKSHPIKPICVEGGHSTTALSL